MEYNDLVISVARSYADCRGGLKTSLLKISIAMFSLLLSGRLGDMLAPRLDFDEELTSLLKVTSCRSVICIIREFDNLKTLILQHYLVRLVSLRLL